MGRMASTGPSLRSRGASSVEYIVAVVLIGITAISGFRLLDKTHKGLVTTAVCWLDSLSGKEGGADCKPPEESDSGGCSGGSCAGGDQCFVAGTPVLTQAGLQPIETITVGTLVRTRSAEDAGSLEWKPVTRTFVRTTAAIVRLTIAGSDGEAEVIEVTPEHLVHARGRGWVEVATLEPGRDVLESKDDEPLPVIAGESLALDTTVFNLAVADDHTYFAGSRSIWVHNFCGLFKFPWQKKKPGGGGGGDQFPMPQVTNNGSNPGGSGNHDPYGGNPPAPSTDSDGFPIAGPSKPPLPLVPPPPPRGNGGEPITDDQETVLKNFSNDSDPFQNTLIKGRGEPHEVENVDLVATAISNLPLVPGTYYRGLKTSRDTIAQWEANNSIQYPGFQSFSDKPSVADDYQNLSGWHVSPEKDQKVTIVFNGPLPNIAPYSTYKSAESEFLLQYGQRLHIKSIVEGPPGSWTITTE
jgi:hypothetical protein